MPAFAQDLALSPRGPALVSPNATALIANASPVFHLLVVDEDNAVRSACSEIARQAGFAVVEASDLAAARSTLKHHRVDLLLLDLKHGADGGLDLLEEVKLLTPETMVIVMTAFASVTSAVEAMRIGAGDYLTKPFALEELVATLERARESKQMDAESRRLRERLRNGRHAGQMIGNSPEMEKLYRILSKVAHTAHPVLIVGESGTGKELIARAIHFNGPSASRPFVPVDCESLVSASIEGELFGWVKGAVPDAVARGNGGRARTGLLASAEGATVFLDEIACLPLELQAKLLRTLSERTVRPVGATETVPLTARVLASSGRDLNLLVDSGKFRRDLYMRLNVVNLRIPSLRERRDDIPALANFFLERAQRESGVAYTFSDETLRVMMSYDWPGNVRELEHAIERACALSSGPLVHMGDLPTQLQDFRMQARAARAGGGGAAELCGLAGDPPDGAGGAGNGRIVSIAEMEKQAILGTVQQLGGDKLMAAKLLGIGKTTLYRKLKEYGLGDDLEAEEAGSDA